VQFAASNYTTSEGAGSITINVTRSGDTNGEVTVDYVSNDNYALVRCDNINGTAYARCDYVTAAGTLRFAVGESTKTFNMLIVDDAFVEGAETFSLSLSNSSGLPLGSTTTTTVTIADNDTTASAGNPIDQSAFYVRQHYLDFLSREPESEGFNAWKGVLDRCNGGFDGSDPTCDRIAVSSSFFSSEEFQMKGYFVYRFYKASLGRRPTYAEIIPDMVRVTGETANELYAKRDAFAANWVNRPDFKAKYDQFSGAAYVDELLKTVGVTLGNRDQLVSEFQSGVKNRAQIVRAIVESPEVNAREYNGAFVAMQYFGYLRRDPEPEGYDAWLKYLTANPTDSRTMVWGFVTSTEYRLRFGQP